MMGRALGIDYGEKRIGLAISDELGIVATPFGVHTRCRKGDDIAAVLEVCVAKDIRRIVVGQPLNMDGSSGLAVEKVDEFVARLALETDLPIELWDERMSTMSATRVLIEGNMRRDRRKGVVDKLAAQIILQNYLDSHDSAL